MSSHPLAACLASFFSVFLLQAAALAGPTLTVQMEGSRTDGQTTPAVDFGTIVQGSSASLPLMIGNAGPGSLDISAITVPTGFRVEVNGSSGRISSIPGTIFEGGTGFFTVYFEPTTSGVKAGDLIIHSNADTTQAQFSFAITGRGANAVPQLTMDGKGFAKIADFDSSLHGNSPKDCLLDGGDGFLYGVTYSGGPNSLGAVFKMTYSGVITVLKHFAGGADGSNPAGGLIKGSDGNFYGTTNIGGAFNSGTIFKFTAAGVFTKMADLNSATTGSQPQGKLLEASDGNFYGLGTYGGNSDQGAIFKMTPAGVVSALALFDQNTTGRNPAGTLVEDSAGNLYGTTINLFGYTGPYDRGAIFRVTPAGIVTVLVNFKDTESTNPSRSLTKGVDGNFYGTTGSGGANKSGIFFKMTPAGVLTKVSDFPTRVPTSNFRSGLMQASDGNFYGTTIDGGAFGDGTLYRITHTGVVNTLVSFQSGPNGSSPLSSLVQASDGNLYGITDYGGTAGAGTAFRLDIQASTSGTNVVPATIGGTFADLDGNATVTLTASAGSIIQNNAAGTWSWNSTGVPAPFSGPVTITATDSDGAIAAEPFTLTLISTSAPEIAVHNGSHGLAPELSDGQSTAVGFGSTAPNVAILRSFLVRNLGTSALTISGITVPSDYTTNAAGTVLAPGGSYGFQVSLKSGTSATYSGNVVISSDDSDEAVFDFPITCTVVAAGSAPLVLISNDIAVPGSAGAPVLGGPVGSTLYTFVGSPAINSSGVLASAVQIRHADASLHTGMMSGQPLSLIATDTQAAPSLPGVNHFNFAPPVINETGHVAFLGEVRGTGITANVNSRCLFSNASDGTLRLVARTGMDIGLGSNLKTIGNFSIGGDLIIFLGTLADKSNVLFGWDASTGLRPLMRNGQSVTANGSPKIVKNFSILETGNASSGHGRELSVAPSGEVLVTFNVTFTDGTFGVIVGSFDGTSDTGFGLTYGASQQLADTYAAPGVIPLAKWNSFRSPGFDNTGSYYGFISQMLTNTLAGVSSTNNVGVFVDTAPGVLTMQLRENAAAPGTAAGVVFSDFSDLVLGGGDYEFLVKGELRGSGVTVNVNNLGLWAQHATNGLVLVAREGSAAPGVAGATFSKLSQIALPGTAQPMFQATMKTGVGGVTTANDTGLWVVNASHNTVLAVREGDVLNVGGTPRSVTAITALLNGTTTGGALGRRAFLTDGQLSMLLNFSGGVQAHAKVVVP